MSNEHTNSHRSGDSRRRSRSRGGRSGGSRNSGGSHYKNRSQRSEEYHPQSSRSERKPPVKPLTWWQKLLQAIGLYKAPVTRTTSKPATAERTPAPAKSNTRTIRSGEGQATEAKPKQRSPRGESKSRGGDPSTVESSRVYVGNLSYDVTEHDLEELFKGVGGVRNVEIVYNRATHRSKGYGFVEMLHRDEAMRSVEVLNDQPFMGRKLVVSGAKARGSDERENEERGPEERVVVAPVPANSATRASASQEEPVIETVHDLVEEEPRPA